MDLPGSSSGVDYWDEIDFEGSAYRLGEMDGMQSADVDTADSRRTGFQRLVCLQFFCLNSTFSLLSLNSIHTIVFRPLFSHYSSVSELFTFLLPFN
jgi:hypothetical protein